MCSCRCVNWMRVCELRMCASCELSTCVSRGDVCGIRCVLVECAGERAAEMDVRMRVCVS